MRNEIRNSKIKFHISWVKAHIGECYNEQVDIPAKEATRKENLDFIVCWLTQQVKRMLHKGILKKWQDSWVNENTGRYVYSYYPKVR